MLEHLPHVERTMTEAIHQPHFSFDPFIIVRGGAWHAVMEELLLSAGDVNSDGEVVMHGAFHHLSSQLPGARLIEVCELKILFRLQ